jgi:carbonic anhydrase
MKRLEQLFANNLEWARRMRAGDPDFFERLAAQQAPQFLWIGCSDSRVPANEIVGLLPGEVFVHRNIANLVVHTDLNCLSVIQFAVDILAVRHIIVCGHYGCSGVRAVMTRHKVGLSDNWLRHVQDVQERHAGALAAIGEDDARLDRLCELNVLEQVAHVCHSSVVQEAWLRGQPLTVHGWIYGLRDGLLRDLGFAVERAADLNVAYAEVLARLRDGNIEQPLRLKA